MDDELSRAEKRDQYEAILGIVEHNTGEPGKPQSAIIEPGQITLHAKHRGIKAGHAKQRIKADIENNDLLEVQYRGVVRNTRDGLQAALGEINRQRQTIVEALNEGSNDE